MTHTQFHLTVHAQQLPGAVDRLAHMFAQPLIRPEAVLPEVCVCVFVCVCVCVRACCQRWVRR